MYRIGDFSKMSKTSIKTLRYYDEVGLLKPVCTDSESNYRFYTSDQLFSIHQIRAYRQMGLSIDEISLILLKSPESTEAAEKKILEHRTTELLAMQSEITEQLERIKFIQNGGYDEKYMNYRALVKDIPEYIVYSKKMKLSGYDEYFEVIPKLGAAVTELNPTLKCAIPEYCFVVYLDGEYREKDINIEFCEAVTDFGICPEGVEFKKIAPVTVASVMHKGPYEELGLAYAYISKWVEQNGYMPCDNPREVYIDGIWNKDDNKDWLTEIQIPVTKKRNA